MNDILKTMEENERMLSLPSVVYQDVLADIENDPDQQAMEREKSRQSILDLFESIEEAPSESTAGRAFEETDQLVDETEDFLNREAPPQGDELIEQTEDFLDNREPAQERGPASTRVRVARAVVNTVGGGVLDATQGTVNAFIDVANVIDDLVGTDVVPDDLKIQAISDLIPPMDGAGHKFARGMAGYLVPYLGVGKALRLVGMTHKLSKAVLAGAAADFLAIDPDEKNLTEMLIDFQPWTGNIPFLAYIGDPDVTGAEKRFRNVLEGAGFGAGIEVIMRMSGALKSYVYTKRAITKLKNGDTAVETALKTDTAIKTTDEVVSPQSVDAPAVVETPPAATAPAPPAATAPAPPAATAPAPPAATAPAPPAATAPAPQISYQVVDSMDAAPKGALKIQLNDGKVFAVDMRRTPKSNEIVEIIRALSEAIAGDLNTLLPSATRETRSNALTIAAADKMGLTQEEFLRMWGPGSAVNAETAYAAGMLVEASVKDLKDTATRYALDKARPLAERTMNASDVNIKAQQVNDIVSAFMGVRSEAGRALQIYSTMQPLIKEAMGLSKGFARSTDYYADAIYIAAKTLPQNMFTKALQRGLNFGQHIIDAALEIYSASLLSTTSAAKALVGNTGMMIGDVLEESLIKAFRDGRHADFADIGVLVGEYVRSTGDGLRMVWDAMVNEKSFYSPQNKTGTLAGYKSNKITAQNYGMEGSVVGSLVDAFGRFARLPRTLQIAVDDFSKTLIHRGYLRSKAHIAAVEQGLSGDAYNSFIQNMLDNPPADLLLGAVKKQDYLTLTKKLDVALTQKAEDFVNAFPLGRFFVPFTRVPLNAVEFTLERTPGLRNMSPRYRDMMGFDPDNLARSKAQAIIGTTLLAAGGVLAYNGVMTGLISTDPATLDMYRRMGYERFHLRIGDKSFDMDAIEPYGNMMKITAGVAEVLPYLNEMDASEYHHRTASILTHAYLPEESIGTIAELMNIMAEGKDQTLDTILARIGGRISPLSNQIRRTHQGFDGIRRSTMPRPFEAWELLTNEFKKNIPVQGYQIGDPVFDLWGDPVMTFPGNYFYAMSPISGIQMTNSPTKLRINDELQRLGMVSYLANLADISDYEGLTLGRVRDTFTIGGVTVQLNNKQYQMYQLLAAGKPADLMGNRVDLLTAVDLEMSTPRYSNLSDEAQAIRIKQIFSLYRQAALSKLVAEFPELIEQAKTQGAERAERITQPRMR